MALHSGSSIGDRYLLHRLIATGGMGEVWDAADRVLGRHVAVKVLKSEFSADPEFLERFRVEARTTARLNHPGIASIYDYGETRDDEGRSTAYLVMELVNGEPLNAVLSRVGRLSLANALDLLEQTGRALQVAHSAGLVHRDVKPGNILITPAGQAKITDFGIAKAVDAAPVTRTGMVMGTAQYIAPEQALGQDATAASDVYSLGVVGYEVLSGRRPFTGEGALTVAMKHIQEPPQPLPEDLPQPVRELIEITLSKDPAQRYRNGDEFADAVAAVRAGRRAPVPGQTATSRVMPPTGVRPVAGSQVPPRTQMMPSTQADRAAPAAAAAHLPPRSRAHNAPRSNAHDPAPVAPRSQKILAWAAGIFLGLALVATAALILATKNESPGTTPAPTSTPAVSTSKASATTKPSVTTTYEQTYEQTYEAPTTESTTSETTTPTTTPPAATTKPTVSKPGITILPPVPTGPPSLPQFPGGGGGGGNYSGGQPSAGASRSENSAGSVEIGGTGG